MRRTACGGAARIAHDDHDLGKRRRRGGGHVGEGASIGSLSAVVI
jgi:hypothetical protein